MRQAPHSQTRMAQIAPLAATTFGLVFALLGCSEAKRAAVSDTQFAEDTAIGEDAAAPDAAPHDSVTHDVANGDTPSAEDTVIPTGPCEPNPCVETNRTACRVEPGAGSGFRCDCAAGFTGVDGACIDATCDDEVATTGVTVIDLTALPATTNPVKAGFDPLLAGDRARVVVDFARVAGDRPVEVVMTTGALAADAASFRLDDQVVTPTFVTESRVSIAIPIGKRAGRVFFEGTIATNGPGLLALEARLLTTAQCNIVGSGSGARIQLTGSVNPKYNICNDLSDLKSLQISAGIPDKDTSVYAARNGSFEDLSATYKILTQMTLCLQRPEGYTVSLAGSADGTRPWTIDNFLLMEVFDGDPTVPGTNRIDAWVTTSTGATAPSRFSDGTTVKMLAHASLPGDYTGSRSPSPFTFPAKTVQLNIFVPSAQRVWLRLTGLDSGVAGHLSRLYLHVSPPEVDVPECRSAKDCPREDSYDGTSVKFRSGCLEGRCTAIPCSAGTPCELGQLCSQGFCTDGCARDDQCRIGQVCGMGMCTELTTGGCKTFADCPTGEVCFFGRCEAGCFHPVNQQASYSDNYPTYSICRATPAACPRCGDLSSRCWNNYCRDCEIDAHCSTGQVCNDFKCVVSP